MIEFKCPIDVKKLDGLCECIIYHYWYFININFRFQTAVCSCCHRLMQRAMGFNNVTIIIVKRNDNRIHFFVYEQRWSHKFIKKCWFDWKGWNIMEHKNLLSHIKMGKKTKWWYWNLKKNAAVKVFLFSKTFFSERSSYWLLVW